MIKFVKLSLLLLLSLICFNVNSQQVIEAYRPLKTDSIRTGIGKQDFMPFINSGYTLMLPEAESIKGVLILLEDSQLDQKNRSAKQLYSLANEQDLAVLSVSTQTPLDFYFTEASQLEAHHLIEQAFNRHKLPNQNIFFLGASLVGHRAMRYIKFVRERDLKFQPNIKGIVMCNFTLDFTRKWHQHQRDLRIKRIDLWEPTFINYMLETNLQGTPETNPEAYFDFSAYSYTDPTNRNIKFYTDLGIRAYIEPAIKYKLTKQLRTLYENNATDMVGFLAEQELAGNTNTELIVLQPEDNPSSNRNTQSTWDALDKKELMQWITKNLDD